MLRFRSYFFALLATAAFTQVASAADMPIKAPAPLYQAPIWSWNGLYVGVNAGYGIGWNRTTQTVNGIGGVGGLLLTNDTLAPQGFVGGGQIGYNWQWTPNWLLGVEVDFQGTSQKDSSCSLECGLIPLNASQKMPWFGTARARLGYVNGNNLWYVTGGGAWAKINSDYSVNGFGGGTDPASFTETKGGFAVGAGVETHLAGNWTAKLEYLYVDLGTITNTYATPSLGAGTSVTVDSKIRDNIVRVGLNYKLTP
jgi:outer membrane immunogenic protein